ncbi:MULTISPECIES: TetR family transcriptional regulator [Streptomyces]|uniref:TetR/AcrR family transcriptional regulator n=1 Tax=Streptomyces tricolor TaxID=68277 RepID=A0ABS9JMJ7_9ACTN|nr:TetR family transcriptional regulator [Streptomyces tricolor]MCG0066783.1 TetR/AcrR family transcriptional regulator [Streptomyces tricolor]MYU26870.1 TetR family transcriptional regulator [Streptomyces sp. SID7810]CUW25698.1 Bacterial regulatory proteins, tetR family [Streptomyces reticuli]
MSSSSAVPAAKPPIRDALVAAAFRLFLERGYEQTTVDDIVALAGVGRRSFFRYFPSKEDVVFPDHERCLAEMTAFLAAGGPEHEPVRRVCDAARLVLRMYAENPAFSVQRYRLTRQVPGLRAYELSVVWRYERALAEYLRARFTGRPDGTLRADVIAAAVVAAHNNALRSWLRSDGKGDPGAAVDHALGYVQMTFGRSAAGVGVAGPAATPTPATWIVPADTADTAGTAGPVRADAATGRSDDVVVLVSRRDAPLWRVVQELETALGRA